MHDCVQWPSKGTYHDYPPITCDDRDSICSAAHMKRQPPAARGGGGGGHALLKGLRCFQGEDSDLLSTRSVRPSTLPMPSRSHFELSLASQCFGGRL